MCILGSELLIIRYNNDIEGELEDVADDQGPVDANKDNDLHWYYGFRGLRILYINVFKVVHEDSKFWDKPGANIYLRVRALFVVLSGWLGLLFSGAYTRTGK